jgi:predicted Zn-dependent protease
MHPHWPCVADWLWTVSNTKPPRTGCVGPWRTIRAIRARYNLIQALRHNGKEEEAQEHEQKRKQREDDLKRFHEIVTRDMAQKPHDPALHFTLGKLLLRCGKREEGLRWLHNALRLDPNYAPARQALAEQQKETRQ